MLTRTIVTEIKELFQELLDAVATAVAVRLRSELMGGPPFQPRLLSVDQAALYLGRTKAAIQHMISDGTLRTVRGDRRVFLDKNDLDEWIEKTKV
jgi:excisionase family DNA binding protein